jgi:alkanesulfonate monooxygenase SsuD/methylene tetrahydromethanopterin reductase-like flavin-dependent oxidoreductase (luciferase family)
VEFGAHLPQIAWGDGSPSFGALADYVRLANAIGMRWLTANDHLVFGRPWLDGHVALSSVLEASGSMTVATSIALPVVRGPAPLAKTLAAIDRLSGGRLVVGVGPGSSEHDYRAAGIPWEDRWQRFEEAVQALRALLRPGGAPFEGRFYSTAGMDLLPPAAQAGGPPIWVGSWGSDTALRRVARLGDGWLASGYNATPEGFSQARARLGEHLRTRGLDPERFPNAIASMFMYVTENMAEADDVVSQVLAPTLRRDPEQLRERLLVGSAGACADKLERYAASGAERVLLWPVWDEVRQLERFHESVSSRLGRPSNA